MSESRQSVVAALALGAGTAWNMTSVGAIADSLGVAYGVDLAVVGLLTTGLALTHFLIQLPGGVLIDRLGAPRVGSIAMVTCAGGNALGLLAPDYGVGLGARAVVGLGTGVGFVAGADLMRVARPSPVFQGLYGSSTMAGGGLAVAAVPQLEQALQWRAPYLSGLLIAIAVVFRLRRVPNRPPVSMTPGRGRTSIGLELVVLGAVLSASFGFSVIAANWIVVLLKAHGTSSREAALVGACVLLPGIASRPLGAMAFSHGTRVVRHTMIGALGMAALGYGALTTSVPVAVLVIATFMIGMASGLPFAVVFGITQRLYPDTPATALAFVNACAALVILVGIPVTGLAFELPGQGRPAFAGMGALCLACSVLVCCVNFDSCGDRTGEVEAV